MGGTVKVNRRPIGSLFRKTAPWAVRLCLRFGIHPDAVSWASLVAAALAAACFFQAGAWPWLLLPAPLFAYLRLWLNMLDGMVALASGKASRRGELINELPDRISDILIFTGVAHSGLCHPLVAYWALILALMTAYVATLGQAVGARREYGGVMSKPWRMVALHVGAWGTLALFREGGARIGPLTFLDWTNLLVIAGCLQTISIRLARILGQLSSRTKSSGKD